MEIRRFWSPSCKVKGTVHQIVLSQGWLEEDDWGWNQNLTPQEAHVAS